MRCLSRRLLRPALLGAAILALTAGGCAKKPAGECRQVFGLDGRIQIGAPPGWTEMPELHASADLEIGSETADAYLLVVSERKAVLRKDETLEQYSAFTREGLGRSLDFPQNIGPRRLKVGGLPALQYEIRAYSKSNQRLVYLHTSVESPEYFHQIVGWTTAAGFKSSEAVLKAITDSFRENPPSASVPARPM